MKVLAQIVNAMMIMLLLIWSQAAIACQIVTPQQIANALQNSPTLSSSLKSCAMAAMAMGESGGGHTCANNNCCEGILQLNMSRYSQSARLIYRNSDLQTQVNGWAATANSNATGSGYKILNAAYTSGQKMGGTTVTSGMLSACEQFGNGVCSQNVAALQRTGTCGTYTDGAAHRGGQTICSWGHHADVQASNQNCTLGACKSGGALPTLTTPNNSVGTPGEPVTTPQPTTNSIITTTPLTT